MINIYLQDTTVSMCLLPLNRTVQYGSNNMFYYYMTFTTIKTNKKFRVVVNHRLTHDCSMIARVETRGLLTVWSLSLSDSI